jgi:hypothetical protein
MLLAFKAGNRFDNHTLTEHKEQDAGKLAVMGTCTKRVLASTSRRENKVRAPNKRSAVLFAGLILENEKGFRSLASFSLFGFGGSFKAKT